MGQCKRMVGEHFKKKSQLWTGGSQQMADSQAPCFFHLFSYLTFNIVCVHHQIPYSNKDNILKKIIIIITKCVHKNTDPARQQPTSPACDVYHIKRVLLRLDGDDNRMMIHGAKYLCIYQNQVYLAVWMFPYLEHPPIFLLASKLPNTKFGSTDSVLRCLFSTLLVFQQGSVC